MNDAVSPYTDPMQVTVSLSIPRDFIYTGTFPEEVRLTAYGIREVSSFASWRYLLSIENKRPTTACRIIATKINESGIFQFSLLV